MDKHCLLLVEDHDMTRRALTILLQREGYKVSAAETLAEGRAIVFRNGITVAVVDLMLPDGHGTEIIRLLKQRCSAAKIIVTTGASDPKLLDEVEALKPDAILFKPVSSTQIIEIIHESGR